MTKARDAFQAALDALPAHLQANLARLVRHGTLDDLDTEIRQWKGRVDELREMLRDAWSDKQRRDRTEEIAAARARIRNLQAKRRRRMSGPRKRAPR